MRCCGSPPEQRKRGVIAASAGNHAQGIAYHGSLLGIPVTVVMPKFAALIKVTNCRQLGAHGRAARRRPHRSARARRRARGSATASPSSIRSTTLDVMAGQGTMALEILEQTPDLEAVDRPRRRRRPDRGHRHGDEGDEAVGARRRRRARACRLLHRGAGGGRAGDGAAVARRSPTASRWRCSARVRSKRCGRSSTTS